jgi:hypothetical protein
MKKRVLSLLLVMLMVMSLVPTSAFAANDVVPYGVTGGYLYFDRSTGEIVDCDETVTEAAIPSVIRDKEVKRIAAYAFEDCNVLKRITIPSTVTLLSEQAFFGCGGLESIEVDKSNSAFLSEGGVLFSKDRAALYVYPCNKPDEIYTMPSSVICIYDNAFFANTRAKKIVISENTRVIGNGAFFSCDSLEEIFVPKCVESIGYAAFSCCERLKNISVAKDNPSYREIDGVVFSNDMTILEGYPAGKTDTTYVIPNGVKYIGEWAFGSCDQLINITLPDGIVFVGASAFYECTGLKSITLPSSVSYIGDRAFKVCGSIETITIPSGVEEIGEEAFMICTSLKSINIPKSVTKIGNSAFDCCSSLTDVYYEGSSSQWRSINLAEYNTALTSANIHFNSHVHTYEGYTVTAPTCTEPGYTTHKCTSCDYSYNDSYIEPLGHNYTEEVTKPTCTERGYTTYTCSCGDSYKSDYKDALGHDYKNGTCTRCGVKDPNYKPQANFIDVAAGSYCYDAVQWAVANGITNGTDTTHFSPNAGCTRGQVVTFLWRAAGEPTVSGNAGFVDVVPGSYCYEAVKWAVANGITKGTDATHFSPNATCTRGQVVTFMYRAAGEPAVGGSNGFVDVAAGSYCYNAVQWAVAKGITKGTDAMHFSPNATCTRGQVVTFLYRAQ